MLSLSVPAWAEDKLVVHEWGTFTSLQDEKGKAIGGINSDDEPVPGFVHNLHERFLIKTSELPDVFHQGAPKCHPDVTMRLETPVIYFHPPKSQTTVMNLDVKATFHGGWLTQFYPEADASATGMDRFRFGHLLGASTSSLHWKSLTIGGSRPGPETTEKVWTTPRTVVAASVTTPGGESEKYLFYRGVGHIDAPIRVVRNDGAKQLLIYAQLERSLQTNSPLPIRWIWLAHIRGQKSAFREVQPLELTAEREKPLATISSAFDERQYTSENLKLLRAEMRSALVKEGLFPDEADALLNTWQLSYFKSSGTRIFFIVPRAWTDSYLPLEISKPADVVRAMVGRLELVTPEHRRLLTKIAAGPPPNVNEFRSRVMDAASKLSITNAVEQVFNGRITFAELGVSVPLLYQTYMDLGRFRNALLLDEAKRHPTEALKIFMQSVDAAEYQIQ